VRKRPLEVKAPRTRKRFPNRPLTAEQIKMLLAQVDNARDNALIRLGLSVGLRVSEIMGIRASDIDFERGTITIWDEKKDKFREVMPPRDTLSAVKIYLNSLAKPNQYLFDFSKKTAERVIQKYSHSALGFTISWHALRHTYVARSIELGVPQSVVMANTGDSPATILRHYAQLPEPVMRRIVEDKPIIPASSVGIAEQ